MATWGCWPADQREVLRRLQAEQWRTLPSRGAASLAHALATPLLVAADARRTSPLASVLHLLWVGARCMPPVAGYPIACSGLAILRAARDALGDGLGAIFASEGLLPMARSALIQLVVGVADPPLTVEPTAAESEPAADADAAAGGVVDEVAGCGWCAEVWEEDVLRTLGAPILSGGCLEGSRSLVDGRAYEEPRLGGVPSAQVRACVCACACACACEM